MKMRNKIMAFFSLEGYTPVETNLKACVLFLQKEISHITVVFTLILEDGQTLTQEIFDKFKQESASLLKEKGADEMHTLSLIFTENPEEARAVCADDASSWVIDTVNRDIYIDYNKIEDFYGLKGRLIEFLGDPDAPLKKLASVAVQIEEQVQAEQKKEEKKRFIPWGTIIVSLISLFFYLPMLAIGEAMSLILNANFTSVIGEGQWYRIFTDMYCAQSSYLPVYLYNLLAIALGGYLTEQSIGTVRFLIIFHLTGILASVGSVLICLVNNDTNMYYNGIMGPIMGIFGVYMCYRFRHIRNMRWYEIILELFFCALGIAISALGFSYFGSIAPNFWVGLILGLIAGTILILFKKFREPLDGQE